MNDIADHITMINHPTFVLGHCLTLFDPDRPVAEELRGRFIARDDDRQALVNLIPLIKSDDGYRPDPDYSIVWLCPQDATEGAEAMFRMYRERYIPKEEHAYSAASVSRFWREVVFRRVVMTEQELPIDLYGDLDDTEDEFNDVPLQHSLYAMEVGLEKWISNLFGPGDRRAFSRTIGDLWDDIESYRLHASDQLIPN